MLARSLCAIAATCLCWSAVVRVAAVGQGIAARQITWDDVGAVRDWLTAQGIPAESFAAYVERLREANARRVREGDLDHLVFYLLQSTRFTSEPPIEPALSAKALVSDLDPAERDRFLETTDARPAHVPPPVRARIRALIRALDSRADDVRLAYFRQLVSVTYPEKAQRQTALEREYVRVMRFVYEKEFVAQQSGDRPAAVAELYRARGLSTDTAVEAGYLVHRGLGIVRGLDPERRVRRVLIVGPGLDLAPRTALHEAGPPESYQPWAVIDALIGLGLSRIGDLQVVAADINPRVVEHLRVRRARPPVLTLVSEIRDTDSITLADEFREYFERLGRSAGDIVAAERGGDADGHLRKTVRISAAAAHALVSERLDIVTERLAEVTFDLVIATNILPYFNDVELMLAMANVASMLEPGGVFLHNEVRPAMHEITSAVGLPFAQSRHAVIATVRGASAPLFDGVFIHRKR